MMTKKILIIILMLGFSLTLMDMGLWAGAAGILPGADVEQEKTEKKDEEKKAEEKKEEEKNKKEKEKEKKLKRVWTNEDLKEIRKEKGLNITEVSPDPDEKKNKKGEKKVSDPPALVKNKTEGEKLDPKKTEKYWRERKKALVDKIKNNEKEIERLGKKLLQLNLQRGGTYKYQDTAQLEKDIRDTANKLKNLKMGLERMKKELEDLYEEARKAGALPGWLRD
jgi:unconventional prefoldin RPB5 interactor 1